MPIVIGTGGITTPNDLLTLALKHSGVFGVGQTPASEDMNDALSISNLMIGQWNRKRWLIYQLVESIKVSTGAQSYNVGIGLDFSVARPDRLEDAFFRQVNISPNQPDYPLEILESREDYNQIRLKNLTAFPQYIFYDPGFPTGVVYPWPLPQASLYEIHIFTKQVLDQFASLAQTINLPPEYFACIFYNVCRRLRTAYQMPPDPEINALAKDALNVIRGANTQIPRLSMPDELIKRGTYDVYSDRTR